MAKASKSPRQKVKPARAKARERTPARRAQPSKTKAKPVTRASAAPNRKRTMATGPARKPVARKPRKVHFDKKTLTAIRAQLEQHRDELAVELAELEEAAYVSQSEMSGEVSYDEDYADAGSFTFEREKDLSIANNVQDLIDKIERAIGKIDEGTYGICEVCGQPIESARLKALPHALLCVRDKAAEERR